MTVTGNVLDTANITEASVDYNTFVGNVVSGGLSAVNTNSQTTANITT